MSEMEEVSALAASDTRRTRAAIAMNAGGRVIAGTVASAGIATQPFMSKVSATETARH